jgi:alpha-beta hydrolase superfamily lysophospholipase
MFGTRCSTQESLVFETGKSLCELRKEFQSIKLDLAAEPGNCRDVLDYFKFYDMDIRCRAHYFGTVGSGSNVIATHVFMPASSDKTVFLIHGYVLSSFIFNHFIPMLLERNLTVVAFDLPGHGFSSGTPGDIGDFSEYARAISDLLEYVRPFLPKPYAVVGHSAGCAAIFEYINSNRSAFEKHVLVAPLVRSDMYDLSRFGYTVLGWAVNEVPTLVRDCSSDKEYLDFVRDSDPLHPKKVPIRWAKALYEWNERLVSNFKTVENSMLIVQGDKDIVLEYRYNIEFLTKRAPAATVLWLNGAKHDIFQEIEPIRNKLFNAILSYLDAREEKTGRE